MSSVVLFFAIMIFSYAFRGNRDVLDFISLASALISIILALVTIIYSFYTNSRSSNQIDVLNKAARDVREATTTYSTSADSLQENIRLILEKIGKVEEKINVGNSGMNKNNAKTSEAVPANIEKCIKEIVQIYISRGSYFGNLALLACVYVNEKGCRLNMRDFDFIVDDSGLSLSLYMLGYIISASALGIITARIDGSEIIVLNVRPDLKEFLILMIDSYINNSPNPKEKQYNSDIYNTFKSIFNPESVTE